MLFGENNYKFMYSALVEAESAFENDEVPIGAVVVYDNRIVGRGFNQVEKLKDATAHAEIIALTSAMNTLSSKVLDECDLYVTAEPCIMCAGAILLAKIRTVFFSAFEPKFGASGSVYSLLEDNNYNHKPKVYHGLYEMESKNLLEMFFAKKRKSKKDSEYLPPFH
ncbi:MAG: nucleoside deaminase [Bacteroidetes bacterium]|nr:nucleoside deaminase [Bacteroidota bacterium]MBU2508213.1 nucleoside deaminase [Bacteroidota bacterium]